MSFWSEASYYPIFECYGSVFGFFIVLRQNQRAQLSYFCSLSYNSTICPTCPTFFVFLSYILEICPTFLKFSFFSFQNQGKIAETYAYSKNVTLYCFLCQSCVDKYRYFVKQIATTLQVLRKTTFFKF